MRAKSLQSCLTLCNPVDYSLPGSSVHGILQAIIYWSELPCLSPGALLKPASLMSLTLVGRFFTARATTSAFTTRSLERQQVKYEELGRNIGNDI